MPGVFEDIVGGREGDDGRAPSLYPQHAQWSLRESGSGGRDRQQVQLCNNTSAVKVFMELGWQNRLSSKLETHP